MRNKRTGKQVLISMLIVVVWAALGLMTGTRRVSAATITVTSTADSGAGSLRDAIIVAAPGDTIAFAVTGTIGLTSGQLLLNKNLTINGIGANVLTVSGNNASRVFEVTSGDTVSISGLMISNGAASFGGGILNAGALTVNNSTFSGNSASTGGGILNLVGTLTVTNSTFSDNSAGIGGGIFNYGGALTLSNCTAPSLATLLIIKAAASIM